MLKYLRIAVTALSLTACVLLVALWVRSYWQLELVYFQLFDNPEVAGTSFRGHISLGVGQPDSSGTTFGVASTPIDDMQWLKNAPPSMFNGPGFRLVALP